MFIFNYTGIKIYFRLPALSLLLVYYRMAITYRDTGIHTTWTSCNKTLLNSWLIVRESETYYISMLGDPRSGQCFALRASTAESTSRLTSSTRDLSLIHI